MAPDLSSSLSPRSAEIDPPHESYTKQCHPGVTGYVCHLKNESKRAHLRLRHCHRFERGLLHTAPQPTKPSSRLPWSSPPFPSQARTDLPLKKVKTLPPEKPFQASHTFSCGSKLPASDPQQLMLLHQDARISPRHPGQAF